MCDPAGVIIYYCIHSIDVWPLRGHSDYIIYLKNQIFRFIKKTLNQVQVANTPCHAELVSASAFILLFLQLSRKTLNQVQGDKQRVENTLYLQRKDSADSIVHPWAGDHSRL